MRQFIALGFAAVALTGASLTANAALTHYWDFEEPDGTTAPQVLDSVGGDHGTFVNMDDSNRSSDTPAPKIPSTRSLQFAGGGFNDTVMLNSQISLPNASDYTVAVWYKGADDGSNNSVFGATMLGRNSGDIYANFVILNGKAAFIHYNGAWLDVSGTSTVSDNIWHHLAFVHHADQSGEIYVDGQLETTGDATIAGPTYRIDSMMINYPSHYSSGSLDDARVYDAALSASEVLALVPEPASLTLIGIASLGVFARRRRD